LEPKRLSAFLQLRIAVAFLGEREQSAWWNTAFLNSLGFRYLRLPFPKTAGSAATLASFSAACRIHDERIGKGGVGHIFRLPEEDEMRLRRELSSLSVCDMEAMCSVVAAASVLASIANSTKPAVGTGPVHVGAMKDLTSRAGLARAAASYAAAFHAGTHVFPYFA
jgi:hypothetical protein